MAWPPSLPRNTTWPTPTVGPDGALVGEFGYTTTLQTFEVAEDQVGGYLHVQMRGGRGACSLPFNLRQDEFVPIAAEDVGTWTLLVGGDAIGRLGGYGGGGNGGTATDPIFTDGGGGGGGSFLWDPLGRVRSAVGGTGGAAGGVVAPEDLAGIGPYLAAHQIGFYPLFAAEPSSPGVEQPGFSVAPVDTGNFVYLQPAFVRDGTVHTLAVSTMSGFYAIGAPGWLAGQGGNMAADRDPSGSAGGRGNGFGNAEHYEGWLLTTPPAGPPRAAFGGSGDLTPESPAPYWYGHGGDGGTPADSLSGPGGGGGGGGLAGGGGGGCANFVRRWMPDDPILGTDLPYSGGGSTTQFWAFGPGNHGATTIDLPPVAPDPPVGFGGAAVIASQPWHSRFLRWLSYGLVRLLVGIAGYGDRHWRGGEPLKPQSPEH